jgi:hypothetical protein
VAQPHLPDLLAQDRAERAKRIAAMLDRWATGDVSNEPDWDAESIEKLGLANAEAEAPLPPKTP